MDRNIVVIGHGNWGQNLVRNFAELGALHTFCDSNFDTLKRLAAVYTGVNQETSPEPILASKEIKGVVISLPAAVHYYTAKQSRMSTGTRQGA